MGKKNKKKVKRNVVNDLALKQFLSIQQMTFGSARGEQPVLTYTKDGITQHNTGDDTTVKDDNQLYRFLWTAIKDARVFILQPEHYIEFLISAEHDAFVDYNDDLDRPPISSSDLVSELDKLDAARTAIDDFWTMAQKVPAPDMKKWPFSTFWIAFGLGVPLAEEGMHARLSPTVVRETNPESAILLGQLYTYDENGYPYITEAMNVDLNVGGKKPRTLLWSSVYKRKKHYHDDDDTYWVHPVDLNPWIIPKIIDFINSFGTYILENNISTNVRYDRERMIRKSKIPLPIPKPYYVIPLKSKIESQRETRAPRVESTYTRSYRTDVRGHERCRVFRQPLPVKPALVKLLHKRGYRVYINEPMKAYDVARLVKRGISPKRRNEMVAIKVSWVRDHMNSLDENLPYVPAIREAK
jgi:hypothetical protein